MNSLLTFASINIWMVTAPGPVYLFDLMINLGDFKFLQERQTLFRTQKSINIPIPTWLGLTSLDSNWLHNTNPIRFPSDENTGSNQTECHSTNTNLTSVCSCFLPNWHSKKNLIVSNSQRRHLPLNIHVQCDMIHRESRQFRWVLLPMWNHDPIPTD